MKKQLLSIPFNAEGWFTKAELDEWLASEKAYIKGADQNGRGDDWLRVAMSVTACGEAESDHEAELVRRGIRLGLQLAAFDRKLYHKNVARSMAKDNPRSPTVTDEQIRAACQTGTRQQQADHLGITLRHLQRRLANMK